MSPMGNPSSGVPFIGTRHMVSSGHYLASVAGFRILEEGGNAIDAGVASGIALNVTLPHLTSFGGVAPIILYRADREEVATVSGLGRWPKAADLNYYKKRYNDAIPLGIPRSVTPAACDAWLTALERFGTMTFEQAVAPSLELAEKGFPTSYHLGRRMDDSHMYAGDRQYIESCPSTVEIFMPGGKPFGTGEILVQRDLARLFHNMIDVERANAHKGRKGAIRAARDYFYKGEVAEKMVRFSDEQDGLLTMEDFTEFSVDVQQAEAGSYKDYTVYTCGVWCQGPALIEVLKILEGIDLQAMGYGTAQYYHTVVEAIKLAFADRHQYYGDPDFVDVPLATLNSAEHAAQRRSLLDPDRAWSEMPPAGDPWGRGAAAMGSVPAASGPRGLDTSYTAVVDRWGNAFSATPSDGFTSTPIVPGLGLIISPRGQQSWLEEDHPGHLGPGRRPRLTPNPAMAFKNGKLFMPFGTPGADMQVQSMAQMFLNIVEFGMDPQRAADEPRVQSESFPSSGWPHPYHPGRLTLESSVGEDMARKLAAMGHEISWWEGLAPTNGDLCGIVVDRERGVLVGGADTRWDASVVGW